VIFFAAIATSLVCAVAVINAAYFGVGFAQPLHEFHFFNPIFQSIQVHLPSFRVPLPADFITAFDHLAQAGRRWEWNNIIFAQWHGQGIWYYYLVLWLYKTPLATLIFICVGLAFAFRCQEPHRRLARISLFVFTVLVLIYFSAFVKVQVGFRYALLCIPLFMIIAACGVSDLCERFRQSKRSLAQLIMIAALVIGCLFELAPYWSNTLSFSNSLIKNKKLAYQVLADSNIDWGQNRSRIQGTLAEHRIPQSKLNPPHLLPGLNVYEVNQLLGVFWNFEQHRWLRENLTPVRHFDHTLLLFRSSTEEFLRFLASERKLKAWLMPQCSQHITSTKQDEAVAANSLFCLPSAVSGLLRVQVLSGYLKIGEPQMNGSCEGEWFSAGQEAWFSFPQRSTLLGQGKYVICAESQRDNNKKALLRFQVSNQPNHIPADSDHE
jgi:hypothetical protein